MVARAADSLMVDVLKDDRLVGRTEEVRQSLCGSTGELFALPELVWERLQSLTSLMGSPGELRQVVCRGQLALCGGVRVRVIDRFESAPFDLATGDVQANLEALVAGEEPEERVTWNVWTLGREGLMTLPDLGRAVKVIKQLGGTSKVAEQGHTSITQVRNNHKRYCMRQLFMRVFLHTAFRFTPKTEEKLQHRLEDKLDRLECKNPNKLNMYNMHVRAVSKASWGALGADEPSFLGQQDVIRDAGEAWKEADSPLKRVLQEKAEVRRKSQRTKLENKKEAIEQTLWEIEKRKRVKMFSGESFRATAGCKWSQEMMDQMEEHWLGNDFGPTRVDAWIKRTLEFPNPVDPDEYRLLQAFPQPHFDRPPLDAHTYDWARAVSIHRKYWPGCVLNVGQGETKRSYMYAHASGIPFRSVWTPLFPDVGRETAAQSPTDLVSCILRGHRRSFAIEPATHCKEEDITPEPGEPMAVTQCVHLGKDLHAHLNMNPLPWNSWLERLPPLGNATEPREKKEDEPGEPGERPYWAAFKKPVVRGRRQKQKTLKRDSDSSSSDTSEDYDPAVPRAKANTNEEIKRYMERYRAEYAMLDLPQKDSVLGTHPRGAASNQQKRAYFLMRFRPTPSMGTATHF